MMHHRLIALGLLGGFLTACDGGPPPAWRVEPLVPIADTAGPAGLAFDADGELFAASAMGRKIYRIDVKAGRAEVIIGPPDGSSDDLAFSSTGLLAWTAIDAGAVRVRRADGRIEDVATGLPFINSIRFAPDGRLFAAQVTPGKGNLYLVDTTGGTEPEVFIKGLPALNAFEITDDNQLYGPLAREGSVVAIDLDDKSIRRIADGFEHPTAVTRDTDGNLYVSDWLTGDITRVDPDSGARQHIAHLQAPIDNLTIGPNGRLYASLPCEDGIVEIDLDSLQTRTIVNAGLGLPGGLALARNGDDVVLFLANMICEMTIDTVTGETTRLPHTGLPLWPTMVAVDEHRVVFSSVFTGAVQVTDRSTGDIVAHRFGFKGPYGIALLPDGRILVAEYRTGRILDVDPDPDVSPRVFAADLEGPVGLAVLGGDTLYVTEHTAGRLIRIDLASGRRETVLEGLDRPEGLTVIDATHVAVVETGKRQLLRVATDSGVAERIATDLPIGLSSPFGPDDPYIPTDVVATPAGEFYVSSDLANTVLRITRE